MNISLKFFLTYFLNTANKINPTTVRHVDVYEESTVYVAKLTFSTARVSPGLYSISNNL